MPGETPKKSPAPRPVKKLEHVRDAARGGRAVPKAVHPANRQGRPLWLVLVVGAGIAGIQASLDLAESGYKVYLVEKNPSIGGAMTQLDKTFPTNDCSMCIVSPKLVECARHPNIEHAHLRRGGEAGGGGGALQGRACARRRARVDLASAPAAGPAGRLPGGQRIRVRTPDPVDDDETVRTRTDEIMDRYGRGGSP